MKHVKKSVLLWYSPREMYDLVTDVQAYPSFLPWCARAEVLESSPTVHVTGESVTVNLVDGPFSMLEGQWLFHPLGASASSGEPEACKIEFDLRYAFKGRTLEALLSPVFDRVAGTLVDSFVKRAEQVHGSR